MVKLQQNIHFNLTCMQTGNKCVIINNFVMVQVLNKRNSKIIHNSSWVRSQSHLNFRHIYCILYIQSKLESFYSVTELTCTISKRAKLRLFQTIEEGFTTFNHFDGVGIATSKRKSKWYGPTSGRVLDYIVRGRMSASHPNRSVCTTDPSARVLCWHLVAGNTIKSIPFVVLNEILIA